MDLFDTSNYDVQLLTKLPPLQPSVALRREQCATAAERRAPIAMPSADDRTRRMRDVELFLGPAFCEQSTKAQQYSKGHAMQLRLHKQHNDICLQ